MATLKRYLFRILFSSATITALVFVLGAPRKWPKG